MQERRSGEPHATTRDSLPWPLRRRWAWLPPWRSMDAAVGRAQDARYIVVQSTTSTENSGLFKHLLPMFTAKTGIEVRVVAVGTGQAIKNAQNGDGDVLFVHDKPSEEKFVAEGWGVKRFDVMYNDFVVIGPAKDPAGIAGCQGRGGGLQEDRRGQGGVRLARRRQRHAQGGAAALAGRGRRRQGGVRHLVPRGRQRHGRHHQHRRRHGRLRVHRPRHLVELQEPRRLPGSWSRATRSSSTSTA